MYCRLALRVGPAWVTQREKVPWPGSAITCNQFSIGQEGENTHLIFSLEGLVSGKRIAKVFEGSCIILDRILKTHMGSKVSVHHVFIMKEE